MGRRAGIYAATALAVLALGASGCGMVSGMVGGMVRALPVDPAALGGLAQTSLVVDAKGRPITTLHAEQDRRPVELASIPEVLVQAVLAAEDRRFFEHDGVDVRGIVRAALTDAGSGQAEQGGSTITQQLVKNTLVTPERSVARKVREASLALGLERSLTKDQILERYLNTVYFGEGAYGVGAAARVYFGHPVTSMTAAESALLAGLIRSPGSADPILHPSAAAQRRSTVLAAMVETGALTRAQAEAAAAAPLPRKAHRDNQRYPAAYAVSEAVQQLLDDPRLGATRAERQNALFRGGLRIKLTIDLDEQADAETAVAQVLTGPHDPAPAIAAVTPGDGAITALVGGRDFFSTTDPAAKVDLAYGGSTKRQAGSTFKVFTLITALEHGIRPDDLFEAGKHATIPRTKGPTWEVDNYEGEAFGRITLRQATEDSVNTAYARVVTALGHGDADAGAALVVDTAEKLGIRGAHGSHLRRDPSTTLGAQEVDPVSMAAAYASLASGGIYAKPYLVAEVDRPDGTPVLTSRPTRSRVIPAGVAAVANDVLADVIRSGTGVRARLPRPVAGKTGTSSGYHDAWFVGYTPNLAAAVWLGVPTGAVSMTPENGFRTIIAGGTFPAEIWRRFVGAALLGKPAPSFDSADGAVLHITVDTVRGCLPNQWTPPTQVETRTFLRGTEPTRVCTSPTGPPATTVPGVLGQRQQAAQAALDAAGFQVVVQTAYDATYPAGTVIGQQPASGVAVAAGSTVTLTVAGRAGVDALVPDLLGLDLESAQRALAAAGFSGVVQVAEPCTGTGTTCAAERTRAAGHVWRQDVAAGTTLPAGSRITFAVGPASG